MFWSKIGHFSKALSKGPATTRWVWDIHADAHDLDGNQCYRKRSSQILAANLAHIAVVLFWLAGMHFSGLYFSNYWEWLVDPLAVAPSCQHVWTVVGQDILNQDLGAFSVGVVSTSGFFQMWYSEGITTIGSMRAIIAGQVTLAACFIAGSYFTIHCMAPVGSNVGTLISGKHMLWFLGTGSLAFSGHIVHIALPCTSMLALGIDCSLIPNANKMLDRTWMVEYFGGIGWNYFMPAHLGLFTNQLDPTTGSIFLGQIAAHHAFLGVFLILLSMLLSWGTTSSSNNQTNGSDPLRYLLFGTDSSWHKWLAVNLFLLGSFSIVFAHHIVSMPVYPYLSYDYPAVMALFIHHMWIGGFLILGSGAHMCIFLVRDYSSDTVTFQSRPNVNAILQHLLVHRDLIIGHLVWVTIFLGLHSFGLYVHNDTMQALSRPEDMFSDTSIQLRPIFAQCLQTYVIGNFDMLAINNRLVRLSTQLLTADLCIHHIHAFTIHVTVLIQLKGILFSRSSRLVADKYFLGFRYPCDGPGRGGTCQISPWDHVFLSLFWMYNSISIVIFHFAWKMQSDVWGKVSGPGPTSDEFTWTFISPGDFSLNSTTVNGWLRSFLWSMSAQVIQSYGTGLAAYGLIFLLAHFVWAFSLMFLFSGRGYWQELIESIVWAHHKLELVPYIQPRALSITHGRAVGVAHYCLGGIGCTWSFLLCRVLAVTKL
jgi:photosystem I P700 chlorophyll a apoprotein A1